MDVATVESCLINIWFMFHEILRQNYKKLIFSEERLQLAKIHDDN